MIAIGGFGLVPFYLAVVALMLVLLGIESYGKDKATAFYCWAVLASMILEPSLAYCSSLLGVLLFVSGYRLLAGCFLFSQLPVLLGPCLPFASWWSSLCASGVLFVLFTLTFERSRKISEKLAVASLVLYGTALVIATLCTWELSPVKMEKAEPGYEIGAAVERVSGRKQKGEGKLLYNNKAYQNVKPEGTIYLDHDAHTDWDDANFMQRRPWGQNFPIAGEPLRMAIGRDGALISNLGAALKKDSSHFVYGLMDGWSVVPLAISIGENLVLADSDFTVNCLAPYQQSLIQRITGTDRGFMFFHFVCALMLIAILRWPKPWLPLVLIGVYFLSLWWPQVGDVRYVGRHHLWPHTDLGEGLVRVFQLNGVNARFGSVGAKVLVVGEGFSARRNGEKVVVLEPQAKVSVDGVVYEAGDVPQGIRDGIVDARLIFCEKDTLPSPIYQEDGVIIIATGTPSLLDVNYLCGFL
ncbi:hypothetical protein [Akkermansia massiliensis]|uniref:hypothetical protein n=1 Tax=Akkermansia massiliensis TaxID=2927224 RepID=UPI0020309795|nr:hypothetical protein [Akkermansia sp. B2-R-115]MCM0684630.1 hypothetical protein [Akkermansia sp. B2-R-115]